MDNQLTNKELQEKLKQFPDDAKIGIFDGYGNFCMENIEVQYHELENRADIDA